MPGRMGEPLKLKPRFELTRKVAFSRRTLCQ
jgi:hypothetical protein